MQLYWKDSKHTLTHSPVEYLQARNGQMQDFKYLPETSQVLFKKAEVRLSQEEWNTAAVGMIKEKEYWIEGLVDMCMSTGKR